MTDANERIKDLMIRHLKGDLDASEEAALQSWIACSDENRAIFDQLSDPDRLAADLQEFQEARVNILAKIDDRLRQAPILDLSFPELLSPPDIAPKSAVHRLHRRTWLYAAASVVFLLAAGYLWKIRPSQTTIAKAQHPAGQDIAPGSDKALLTLANGSTIVLENTVNGNLSRQGNTTVVKNNNQLAYATAPHLDHTSSISPLTYNTLTTPRAGQFQLVLPDGTKVWLNNASSLHYPTSFTGSRREVQLSGEAYFEVAADASKPFIVQIDGGLAVNVLGTSFNLMSYKDEAAIKATLLTGKVELSKGGQQSLLKPGEQLIINRQDGAWKTIREADTDEAIAWKRGFFHFVHADIGDVLRQLSRWYDVEVEFTISRPDYTFDGEIDRKLSLTTILKHLEKKDLHFQVDGKKLIVFR